MLCAVCADVSRVTVLLCAAAAVWCASCGVMQPHAYGISEQGVRMCQALPLVHSCPPFHYSTMFVYSTPTLQGCQGYYDVMLFRPELNLGLCSVSVYLTCTLLLYMYMYMYMYLQLAIAGVPRL